MNEELLLRSAERDQEDVRSRFTNAFEQRFFVDRLAVVG